MVLVHHDVDVVTQHRVQPVIHGAADESDAQRHRQAGPLGKANSARDAAYISTL